MANPHLRTRHNYDAFEVVSALQKCIRRGLEEDALYWAYELGGIAEQKPLLVVVGAGKGHRLRGRRSGESHHASLDRRLVAQLEGEKGGAAMVHQRRHRVGAVAEKQDRGQRPQHAAKRRRTRLAKRQADPIHENEPIPLGSVD